MAACTLVSWLPAQVSPITPTNWAAVAFNPSPVQCTSFVACSRNIFFSVRPPTWYSTQSASEQWLQQHVKLEVASESDCTSRDLGTPSPEE